MTKPLTPTAPPPRQVGVVIVTWNSEATIGQCLDSLMRQSQVELSVVVVDNASHDETLNVVGASPLKPRLIANSENVGFARACNQGAGLLADKSYLLLLNPDTRLLTDAGLSRAVQALELRPSAGTLGVRLVDDAGQLQASAFRLPALRLALVEALYLYRCLPPTVRGDYLLGPHWEHSEERSVGWLLGAFLLVRREVWDQLGGLTESFHMFTEDVDWGYRCGAAGWENRFFPEVVVEHLSNHSGSQRWTTKIARSRVSFDTFYAWLRTKRGPSYARAWAAVACIGEAIRLLLAVMSRALPAPRSTQRSVRHHWRMASYHAGVAVASYDVGDSSRCPASH